jgi:hypothetical protein
MARGIKNPKADQPSCSMPQVGLRVSVPPWLICSRQPRRPPSRMKITIPTR